MGNIYMQNKINKIKLRNEMDQLSRRQHTAMRLKLPNTDGQTDRKCLYGQPLNYNQNENEHVHTNKTHG